MAAFKAEKAGALVRSPRMSARVSEKAGPRARSTCCAIADGPQDVARAGAASRSEGRRTRARHQSWLRPAARLLMTRGSCFQFRWRSFRRFLLVFGFLSSIKVHDEISHRWWLAAPQARRRAARLAALAAPAVAAIVSRRTI